MFGFCFLGTLVVVTLGVIVGIAAGNIAHYSKNDFFDNWSIYSWFVLGYFSPVNASNITGYQLNATVLQRSLLAKDTRLWLPINERLKRYQSSSRKTRHSWLLIEKSVNNRGW